MDVFGKDAVIGDFRLSDHDLVLGSFNFDNETVDLGMGMETTESFIGNNPVPAYLGSKHNAKLMPKITIMQNECKTDRIYFTMKECREIISKFMGFQGYVKMYIEDEKYDETMFYNIRFLSASYEKSYDKVIGIIFEGECDSQFAWSEPVVNSYSITNDNKVINIYNDSDDLYNYLLPSVEIELSNELEEKNEVTLVINHVGETHSTEFTLKGIRRIVMDSKKCTIQLVTYSGIIIDAFSGGNDFNMNFIRLKPGNNQFYVSQNANIKFTYNLPRKVGFF